MWFSTEARFPNLWLSLDLWHRNEFESGLRPWFQAQLALQAKWDKVLTVNFTNCLEKCDFSPTTSNIGKLYTIGAFFTTSMNLISLPQNKASLGSNPLANFTIFVWKSVPMIRVLSPETEGTIMMRGAWWVFWHWDWPIGWLKNGDVTLWMSNSAKCVERATTTTRLLPPSWGAGHRSPLSLKDQMCVRWVVRATRSHDGHDWDEERERRGF